MLAEFTFSLTSGDLAVHIVFILYGYYRLPAPLTLSFPHHSHPLIVQPAGLTELPPTAILKKQLITWPLTRALALN